MRGLRTLVLAGVAVALLPQEVAASSSSASLERGGHFRYATMYWKRSPDLTKNKIEVTIESAWRRDYSSTYFTAGLDSDGKSLMKINGKESPMIDFGDHSGPQYLEAVQITAYSESENWFLGEQTFTHEFDTPNNAGTPWRVRFTGCCRVKQQGQASDNWDMSTYVDLLESLRSPRIVSLPVIWVRKIETNPAVNQTFHLYTAELDSGVTWSSGTSQSGLAISTSSEGFGAVNIDTKAISDCPGDCQVSVAANAHYQGISVPVDLVVKIVAGDQRPHFVDFPSRLTAHVGFKLQTDIKAFQNPSGGGDVYVGFTVGTLPDGLHLSTVRGKGDSDSDPAIMTLRWTPCQKDLGVHVLCMDAVNNDGKAATQRCLIIDVLEDVKPSLEIIELHTNKKLGDSIQETSDMRMGYEYRFNITATDPNSLDMLTIVAGNTTEDQDCEMGKCIPPGAHLTPTVTAITSGGTNGQLVGWRLLTFAPKHNHGGYEERHCFTVQDSCGGSCKDDSCPGNVDMVTKCVIFKVRRCEMVVRKGQQLQQIAAIYHSDWLQIWSHNDNIYHPDMELQEKQVLNIGHLYDVQPLDKPLDVARRFGMDATSLRTLNADLGHLTNDALMEPLCDSAVDCRDVHLCILPNSCTGMSSSIYHQALKEPGQEWYAGAKDGSPAPEVTARSQAVRPASSSY